jgi:hypothetical protein
VNEVNWREDKAFLQFLELEFGPTAVSENPILRAVAKRVGQELVLRLYRAFYAGKMSEGGGNRKTLAQLYREGEPDMSAEEFWRRHPNPTLQERIDYLEHCYAVDPISRDTRIQLSKQIDDLKAQLKKREGKGDKE